VRAPTVTIPAVGAESQYGIWSGHVRSRGFLGASTAAQELRDELLLGLPSFSEHALKSFTATLISCGAIREGEHPAEPGKPLCGVGRVLEVPTLAGGVWV
jgi:hypothetical protein